MLKASVLFYDYDVARVVLKDLGDIEKIMAANTSFPYWVFYTPEADDGTIEVSFYAMDDVKKVVLQGKEETAKLATERPINTDLGPLEI